MPVFDPVELPESEGGGYTYGTPPTLYHYTGQSGLLGILNDGVLRCSNAHFLNDAREVRHAVDLVHNRIEAFAADFERRDPEIDDDEVLLDSLAGQARRLLEDPLFVFSLSLDPDDLSQWRAYCPDEGGYAIGFRSRHLQRLAEQQGFKLTRCIYDEERQRLVLDGLIQKTVEAYQEERNQGVGISSALDARHVMNFVTEFFQHATAFKDPAFREEQEWRLVADPRTAYGQEVFFREGVSTPVPYIHFQLREEGEERLPVSRIWVGPSRNRRLDLRVASQLLDTHGLTGADVQASEIPYRTW